MYSNLKFILLCFSLFLLSGCWDSEELNERALWMATGWDIAENGEIIISGQIIIPSNLQTEGSMASPESDFFVISSKGKDIGQVLENIQSKLPRMLFFGHRRVTIFGEKFAEKYIKEHTDNISRSPDHSLRNDIFVVRGGTANQILKQKNPLETRPAVTALKEHRQSGGRGDKAFLEYLVSINRNGISPTLPAIEITDLNARFETEQSKNKGSDVLGLAGTAIFNKKLELIGFLNMEENKDMLWVMGQLNNLEIGSHYKKQPISIDFNKMNSKIKPILNNNGEISFSVTLIGKGMLIENNPGLDVTKSKNRKIFEQKFSEEVQKRVENTIKMVQDDFKVDIFGFGEAVHKKHPKQWESLKENWDTIFSRSNINVTADIKINQIGKDGPSLLTKEGVITE